MLQLGPRDVGPSVPINLVDSGLDFLVSPATKCNPCVLDFSLRGRAARSLDR